MPGLNTENLNKLAEETEILANTKVNTPLGETEIELTWNKRTGVWRICAVNERGFMTTNTTFPPTAKNVEVKAVREYVEEVRYLLEGK